MTTKSIERGATAFIAREVLDLVTLTERQVASTPFDTRAAAPNRLSDAFRAPGEALGGSDC